MVIALAFFVSIVVVDLLIIHVMNRAVESARRERAQAEHLADERRTLFQELQHRVSNNLAFVASLLSLQKRKHKALPEVAEALDDARLRLDTLSRVHRRLYDPTPRTVDRGDPAWPLCGHRRRVGTDGHLVFVEGEEITLPLDRQMNLTLIVIELISNSLKHAFNGREGGLIQVRVARVGASEIEVIVADDGPGLPDDVECRSGDRLGNRIVQNLARTIGGTITQENDGGAVTRLRFLAVSLPIPVLKPGKRRRTSSATRRPFDMDGPAVMLRDLSHQRKTKPPAACCLAVAEGGRTARKCVRPRSRECPRRGLGRKDVWSGPRRGRPRSRSAACHASEH